MRCTPFLFSLALAACAGITALPALDQTDLRPRLIVETDLGGDSDDQASLVRLLMFSDQFDIEAILLCRDNSAFQVDGAKWNPTGATTTLGMGRAYLQQWNALRPNLVKHSGPFPEYQHLYDNMVYCPDSTTAGRDRIIALVDQDDPRPVWYGNWGDNSGTTSNLRRALDHIKETRSQTAYEDFARRLRICSLDGSGRTRQYHESVIKLHIETGYPVMDPLNGNTGRWYHMFRAINETAGGFSYTRDVQNGHGIFGSWYAGPKEGDSWCFVYLQSQALGVGVPTRTAWGGWGGRYATQRIGTDFPNGAFWWNGNRDTWNGSTSRNHTAGRFAADMQHHFAARLDWGQKANFSEANHPPRAVVNGDASGAVVRLFARPGQQVSLSASGSSDPDGDTLSYRWIRYDEADSYAGAVSIGGSTGSSATVTVPSDADGKEIHLYLEVNDQRDSTPANGRPSLTAYRRVVISVRNQLKVMCLGDSITDGSHNNAYPGAYRIKLWELMQGAGWNVDLVGSKSNGPTSIDQQHEGWIGYRIDELYGATVNLAAKLDTYRPDVVLLMIGTNDALQGTAIAQADHRYLRLLQLIQDRRPDSVVVCAKLPLISSSSTQDARAQDINGQLGQVGVASYHIGQWSTVIDAGLGSADLADGVHPNAAGYAKIAQAFFSAMQATGVGGGGPPVIPNQPPTVSLTAPAAGATFTAPSTITLAATAADSDGSVTKVEFYANGSYLGTDSSAPYTWIWSNAAAGTYNLTARATDDDDATTASAPVQVTVSAAGGGDLIGGLAAKFTTGEFRIGSIIYTDRAYTATATGTWAGATHIRTPNAEKGTVGTGYLVFTAGSAAEVVVAYDSRAASLPAWLGSANGWAPTGETITTTDAAFRLYKKAFAAGATVSLDGNAFSGGSNYWVIVKATGIGPEPTFAPLAVNFQPASAPTVAGYLVDSGLVYGGRSGNRTYGWNAANNSARDRNVLTDQRVDTLLHLQQTAGLVWEAAVPDGTYEVRLVMGDPSYTNQINAVSIEGTVVADADGADNFDDVTRTVTVSDGKLTINPATGASNAKLCYIEIVQVPAGGG